MSTLAAITCHGFSPHSVLGSAFPLADFSAYLRFIEACREKKPEGETHDHHICPRACFPEYVEEPDNLIALSVEDHARAHALLNDVDPELYVNTSLIPAASLIAAFAGRCSVGINKANGTGHFAPGEARRAGLRNVAINKSKRLGIFDPKVCAQGGRTCGLRHKANGTGICGLTLEQRQAAGRRGGCTANHNRWHVKRGIVNVHCELCVRY
jgi:hypothetical protein